MLIKSWLRRVVLLYDSVTNLPSASSPILLDQGFSNCGSEGQNGSPKKICGLSVRDQDKRWAPRVICDYCRRILEAG